MAASGPIRVCVLEGLYAHLSQLGFPLSVAVELQNSNLRLDSAKWSTHQSGGGFSVTFFWPSLLSGRNATSQPARKRNHRRRNHKSKSLAHSSPCDDSTVAISKPNSVQTLPSLFIAHQLHAKPNRSKDFTTVLSDTTTQFEKPNAVEDDSEIEQLQTSGRDAETSEESEDLDTTQDSLKQLLNADTLEFEIRKVPGVKSTISGESNWTPVSIKQPSLMNLMQTI